MKKFGIFLSALVLIAGMSYAAFAESAAVNVQVTANPKLTIEVSTPAVNFGAVDPEVEHVISNAVKVTVKSNKPFNYSYSATDFIQGSDSYSIGILQYDDGSGWKQFQSNETLGTNIGRGVKNWNYSYKITVPYDMADGTWNASITYTAVQN